ncbi:MAG: hypothetical protein V3W44_05115 [Dehalococcoidales bacterium]
MPGPDLDAMAQELAESWINGNLSTVVGEIACLEPLAAAAVASMVCFQLTADRQSPGTFMRMLSDKAAQA